MQEDVTLKNINAENENYIPADQPFEKTESPVHETVEYYCRLGNAFALLGQHDEAEEQFKKAEELFQDDGILYLRWGDALALKNETDLAIEKYKKATEFENSKRDALIQWGNICVGRGEYESAFEKYREILSMNDKDVDAHNNMGICSFFNQDYATAKQSFEKAVELNGENSAYHYWLAESLSYLEDFRAAVIEYEKALELESDDGKKYLFYRNLGFSLSKSGEPDKAIENFEKAEKLVQDDGFLYIRWGDALASKYETALAIEKYEKATAFENSKRDALIQWGNICVARGEYESAYEKYKEITISINDKDVDAYNNMGICSFYTQDYQTAKENFEKAVKLDKENSAYHYWLAESLSYLEDYRASLTEYKKALKLERDDEKKYLIYRNLGYALFKLEKADKAIENFEKAEQLIPDDGVLYIRWGDTLALKNETALAIEKYEKASEFPDSRRDALIQWGNICIARGEYESAYEKYREILSININDVDAYNNMGICSFYRRDYQAAKESFEKAVELNEKNSSYHYWLAESLSYLEDYRTAVTEYKKALELESDNEKKYLFYRNLGFSLFKLNESDQAIENFEKAEEISQTDGFLYVYWGDSLTQKNETELAIEKYKKATGFEESKRDALLQWGNIYYDQRDKESYEAAAEKYREILSINDEDVDAHYNLGLCAFYTQDYEAAKENFENAVEVNKENSTYLFWLGDSLSYLRDYKTAVSKYEEALKFEADNENRYYTYRNLGFALFKLDKPDKAIEKFQIAEKLFQNDGFLYVYWGDSLARKNKTQLAIEKYKKATEFKLSKRNALLQWGNIYYDQKTDESYAAAAEKYREILAIEDNENDIDAHYNLGLCAFYTQDYESAKESFEKTVELNKETKNGTYRYWLADTLLSLNQYQDAIAEYEEALKFDADNINKYYSYRNFGFAHLQLERSGEAIEKFQIAEKLFKDDGNLYVYWGNALEAGSEFALAEEKYQKASKFEDSKFDAFYALGYLYLRQKKYNEAINFFDEAILIKDEEPLTYYNIGQCYSKKGQYSRARENWEKSRKKFEELGRNGSLEKNPSSCYAFAVILHNIYGELTEAEKLYNKVSNDKLRYEDKFNVLSLYLELKDSRYVSEDHTYHWKVQHEFSYIEESFKGEIARLEELRKRKEELESNGTRIFGQSNKIRKEKSTIESDISRIDEPFCNYWLGYLYFQTGRFEEAIERFEKAYKIKNSPENSDNSQISLFSKIELHNALGLCYSRNSDHQKAISFIERAKDEHPGDFEIQNNLASAYFRAYYDAESDISKARYLDLAQSEFEKILLLAPSNIDALIGLGYTKLEQSEFTKKDSYEDVVKVFEKALQLSASRKGSVRINNKLKVSILYHLGYSHIMLYKNSTKFRKDEELLAKAYGYFKEVVKTDSSYEPAIRNCKFLEKNKNPLNPETFTENYAPFIVSLLILPIFILSLTSYFWKVPDVPDLSAAYFAGLAFGSLVLLIAALSLPRLLKLKFGNIELEKEIKKSAPINEDFSFITKQRWSDTSFYLQGMSKQYESFKRNDQTQTVKKTHTGSLSQTTPSAYSRKEIEKSGSINEDFSFITEQKGSDSNIKLEEMLTQSESLKRKDQTQTGL